MCQDYLKVYANILYMHDLLSKLVICKLHYFTALHINTENMQMFVHISFTVC